MKIGIVYGSTLGNTENAALRMVKALETKIGKENIFLHNIQDALPSTINACDLLIVGSSTWGAGDIQDDWIAPLTTIDSFNIKGKKIALFGTGDQQGYATTFVDAIGTLYAKFSGLGAELIGRWPLDGYDFLESTAVKDNMFVGLPLDEDNQSDLTEKRIEKWLQQVIEEAS